MRLAAFLFALLVFLVPGPVSAHALDPGYLELSVMDEARWRVTWRIPDVNGQPMSISPSLPDGCEQTAPPVPVFDGRAWVTSFIATCPQGLAGGKLEIAGLSRTRTDVLVRYEPPSGAVQTHRLTAASPDFTVPPDQSLSAVFVSYVTLGVTHILEGVDHLLFVFALLLLVRDRRRLFWAVTAFTLAHSLTLVGATLGWLRLPSTPVEVVIALSIVFLAWELAKPRERRDPVSERFPAVISFGFGLIHGLGFAGALREIGLPQTEVPMALLAFNFGVELGQLLFIAGVLMLIAVVRRLFPSLERHGMRLEHVSSYVIGTTSAYWVIDRMSGF